MKSGAFFKAVRYSLKLLQQFLIAVVAIFLFTFALFPKYAAMMFFLIYLVFHPMHLAILSGSKPAVHVLSYTPFLQQKMYDIKGDCTTPLQAAIVGRQTEIAEILLKRGANKTCRFNALFYAFGNPDTAQYLINEYGYDYEEIVPPSNRPLYEHAIRCAYKGPSNAKDRETIEIFLNAGLDPNKVASVAIDKDCSDIVRLALDHNADPERVKIETERKWNKPQN